VFDVLAIDAIGVFDAVTYVVTVFRVVNTEAQITVLVEGTVVCESAVLRIDAC
jgi:hypothetical protein